MGAVTADPAERRARLAAVDRSVATVAAAASVAAAGSAFVAAFTTGRMVVLVGLGVVAGGVAGGVLTTRRAPGALRLVVALTAGYAAVAVAVAAASPSTVVRGVVDGPRRLLSIGLPADGDPLAAAVPVVVCGVGSAVAVVLARRGRAGGLPVTAFAVLALATATGLAGGPPRPAAALAAALATLLAVAAAGLVTRAPGRSGGVRPTVRRRRPLGAVVIVALAVVAGAAGGAALADDGPATRSSLRQAVDEPPRSTEVVNPLDAVAEALGSAEDVVYGSVRLDRPDLARLPLATFDAYDGDTFLFGTEVGAPGGGPASSDALVTEELDLDRWPFVPLPHAGPALEVAAPVGAAARVEVDRATGRIVSPLSAAGHWVITSAADEATVAPATVLDLARPVPPLPALPATELDPITEEARAEQARVGNTVALVTGLADRFRGAYRAVAPGAPAAEQRGGHGALVLGCVVKAGFEGRPAACAERVGTRTQLAAAFVLVLRRLGIPTRLGVGWELVPTSLAQPLRAYALTAWAEVAVGEDDWLAVDPVPDETGEVGEIGTGDGDQTDGTTSTEPEDDDSTNLTTGDGGAGGRGAPLAAIGGGLAAFALLAAAPALLRRRRSGRRRRGTPAERTVGAWHEMRDQLRERGQPSVPGAHVTAIVRGHGIDDPSVARAVNAVAFGNGAGDGDVADRAWAALRASDAAWRAAADRRSRLRRYFRCGPTIRRP